MSAVLVTGAAGFIGYHTCARLLAEGEEVVGIDNLNAYYDVNLKKARLAQLTPQAGFSFHQVDLADSSAMADLFEQVQPKQIIHLAAQAGVRYSLEAPEVYVDSNVVGFLNILEGCRRLKTPPHLVFASSSSVYGANRNMPFSEHQATAHPVSLYAATKKSNEAMAHAYAHLFGFPITGLRFFTVYGPWGRPDMAIFLFTKAILSGKPIRVFNHGQMQRDFTYIDDVVEGILRIRQHAPVGDPTWAGDVATSHAAYRLYNIGRGAPVALGDFITAIEKALGQEAEKIMEPMQAGDVVATWADTSDLEGAVAYQPTVSVEEGCQRFVDWYRDFYEV